MSFSFVMELLFDIRTYLHTLKLNNRYQLIHTVRHSTVTVSRHMSVVRIRSGKLRAVMKELQIPWSFLTPRHPQHTKNLHDTDIHTGTGRKLE